MGDGDAVCATCGRTDIKLRLCTRCRAVRYCSTDCQRKDWNAGHKSVCSSAKGATTSGTGAAPEISDETRRTLMELMGKIHSLETSVKTTDAQIQALQKKFGLAQVTSTALSDFPPSTRMFQSVGRMYLRRERPQVERHLEASMEEAETKIRKLKDSREYLLKRVAEAEESVRELKSRG